jgi:hypothetical protein
MSVSCSNQNAIHAPESRAQTAEAQLINRWIACRKAPEWPKR